MRIVKRGIEDLLTAVAMELAATERERASSLETQRTRRIDAERPLRQALGDLRGERALLAKAVQRRNGFLSLLPFLKVLATADRGQLSEIDSEIEALQRRIDSLPPLSSAAEDRTINTIKSLVLRLRGLEADGVVAIRMDADRPLVESLGVALACTPILPSVVAHGTDASALDLSPRSRAARMSIAGIPVAPHRDPRTVLLSSNRHADGLPGWTLRGRTWANWPQGLLAPRIRSAVPMLPGSYATAERFYLPVPLTMTETVTAAGAAMGRRGGFHVDLRAIDLAGPISAFLPFVAQPCYRPLPVAGIPRTTWGMSLAGILSRSSWETIRRSVFERYGELCQICGQMRGGQSPECHEIWDFVHDDTLSGMRRQRLVGLACLCPSCHGAMHQGFSEGLGKGDSAAYRLADINGWTMEEAEIADDCARIDAEQRSASKWFLDLSLLGNRILTLDGAKVVDENGLIVRTDDSGRRTRIVGIAYRLGAKGKPRRIRNDQGRALLEESANA